jgi:hypothetical protein
VAKEKDLVGKPSAERRPASAVIEQPSSVTSGILAGIVAALAGVPLLAVSFIVAEFGEERLFGKVTGVKVHSVLAMTPGQSMLGQTIVAGATGLFAAGIAAGVALLLFKRAHRLTFLAVSALGFSLWALLVWRWTGRHYPTVSVTFFFVIAWLLALLGLYAARAAVDMADEEGVPARVG